MRPIIRPGRNIEGTMSGHNFGVDDHDNTPSLLCDRCAAIDFENIFRRRVTRAKGLRLLKLGKIPSLGGQTSCPVCRFFAQVSASPRGSASRGQETVYSLYAFSAARALLVGLSPLSRPLNGLRSGLCLAILPEEDQGVPKDKTQFFGLYQSESPDTLRFRRLDCAAVDLKIIRQWFQYCTAHHTLRCSLEHADSIPGLRVIDCATRKIVGRLRQPYAALSYVWGDSEVAQDEGITNISLPLHVPAVIEDAMALSIELGVRFLWVDRYCIRQDDLQHKQKQIKHMDLVYTSAEITIVAAAGSDPDHGLPGIGTRRRIPQPAVEVRGQLLLSALPDPKEEIRGSKWIERAWTYQEGMLSRRRLIFTDRQVYFECRTMHCCEALDIPLDAIHRSNKQECKNDILPGIFPPNILGKYPWEIVNRINEYSVRKLRFESDRLNAILGIFHALQRSQINPEYHYLGVPLMVPWPRGSEESKIAFLSGLLWENEKPAERRDCFPSWSWTGWYVKLREFSSYYNASMSRVANIDIKIECLDATLMDWPHGYKLAQIVSTDVSRFLHINAWTFQLRFELHEGFSYAGNDFGFRVVPPENLRTQKWYGAGWNDMILRLSKPAEEDGELYHQLLKETFLGIIVAVEMMGQHCWVLVVESYGDYVERIGIVKLAFGTEVFDQDTGGVLPSLRQLGFSVTKMTLRLG